MRMKSTVGAFRGQLFEHERNPVCSLAIRQILVPKLAFVLPARIGAGGGNLGRRIPLAFTIQETALPNLEIEQ